MNFMILPETLVLSIIIGLGGIIVAIIGYFLKGTMTDLKDTEKLALKTKSELDVLANDHSNKHTSMTDKFEDLKDSIVTLTVEIKELTAKIKN